ncbi:TPA: imidazole glycerol phosphate synthase subunit HisH, partial [Yersinia enterocolitica]
MIKIVDYGLGNVLAFVNVFRSLNIKCETARNSDELYGATHIILPGVGSFDYAVNRLNNSGMRSELERLVIDEEIPVLGVCVGMQLLAQQSDEGSLFGLGWLDARVKKFDIPAYSDHQLCLPHMGWNDVNAKSNKNYLFKNIE